MLDSGPRIDTRSEAHLYRPLSRVRTLYSVQLEAIHTLLENIVDIIMEGIDSRKCSQKFQLKFVYE